MTPGSPPKPESVQKYSKTGFISAQKHKDVEDILSNYMQPMRSDNMQPMRSRRFSGGKKPSVDSFCSKSAGISSVICSPKNDTSSNLQDLRQDLQDSRKKRQEEKQRLCIVKTTFENEVRDLKEETHRYCDLYKKSQHEVEVSR